jgi:hypothetical protein
VSPTLESINRLKQKPCVLFLFDCIWRRHIGVELVEAEALAQGLFTLFAPVRGSFGFALLAEHLAMFQL